MWSRKWLVIITVVLIAGLGVWWWWQSPSSSPAKKEAAERLTPNISIGSVNISDIDAERIKLKSKVTLTNPLPVDINTNKLSYEIFINSIRVIQDSYNKPIRIRSSDSTVIELPMELLAKPMARVLKYFDDEKVDSADYAMKATFTVDVPVGDEKDFTLNFSKRLPALRLPKMKVKDVDLNALRLKKEGVDMVVQIINPNAFPIKLKDGAFSFKVEDDMTMDGVLEKIINIPARGTEDVSMHAAVKEGSVLKTGWKFLTDKKDTRFTYTFRCKLQSENGMLNNSTMAASMQGTLDELVNAVKEIK